MDGLTGTAAAGTAAARDPAWDGWEARVPATGAPGAGVPASPVLHLDGFDGPMDLLLDLAERQKIDFGRMSVLALAEQFVAAMARFGDSVPIERRADWLVIVTRLVLLRSRLLFPEGPAAADAAQRDAATELRRIDALVEVRAVVAWLGTRPVLGQDVFTRGAPELLGVHFETDHAVDVIAFLWASLSLFEDDVDEFDTVAQYRPASTLLYSVTEARDRILRMLGEGGDGETLGHFLPERATADAGDHPKNSIRLHSAWATTFGASLELAKLGDVALEQVGAFRAIHVSRLLPMICDSSAHLSENTAGSSSGLSPGSSASGGSPSVTNAEPTFTTTAGGEFASRRVPRETRIAGGYPARPSSPRRCP